jgi:hypothetical protein
MTRFVLLIPAAAALAAARGMAGPADPPRGEPGPLAYRISDAFYSWEVHQGAELSVVRSSGAPEDGGGEIMMVAGPKVGGPPALMVRNVQVLARALGGLSAPGPGHVSPSGYGGTAVLVSFRFALRAGGEPATIAGYRTTHRVLTVESWWVNRAEDGSRTPVRERGHADLWFAADLPFSWVPFAMPPVAGRAGAALPLSQNHGEISAHVLAQVIDELEPLGLLLRATVVDSVVPSTNPDAMIGLVGGVVERRIEVDSIRPLGAEPTAPEWVGLPVLSAAQGLALELGMLAAGGPCSEAPSAGSYEFSTSGPVSVLAGGNGASRRDGEGLGHASVLLGGRGPKLVECVLVVLSDSALGPGPYRVVPPSPTIFADAGREALVVYFVADPAEQILIQFMALDSGEVRLEAADGLRAKGVIQGTGWAAELDPRHRRRVVLGVGFNAAFDARVASDPGGSEP